MGVVPDSARAAAPATPASNTASTPSAERRRARYDCASCHY
jgi:cytochrome c553